MELWGGPECTVNRVGDRYRDQTCATGHQDRPDDLALFAGLGLKKLRYPVLWERVAPDRPDRPDRHDWRWSDARIAEVERLGMQPIIGLLHHGSGPRYTSLVSDDFVPLFADYAAAAARRYPHVIDWTPVNEPLTTARFSALYGFWYPHACDERSFWTALFNQIDGTRMAMRAIREVNPRARLIQTEDLGHVYSTQGARGSADHLNARRWITWDLLTGTVAEDHPLWPDLVRLGFADRARACRDDPCPPDVIGINHYPTSDRFLDDRAHGHEGPLPAAGYHDLTAARILTPPPAGLEGVLLEAWDRYRLPLAVTESHLGCTREEQVRWTWQAWNIALDLRRRGVDIRAVTAWALLGNMDWTSLLTADAGDYEIGAFDVSSGRPRPTAMVPLLKALGHSDGDKPPAPMHPALKGAGWWQRDIRLEHEPYPWRQPGHPGAPALRRERDRPVLITGATGVLGQALAGACRLRGLPYLLTDRAMLDIGDAGAIARMLDRHQPWAVINAAGWTAIDAAEQSPADCMRANADGPALLAAACGSRGIHCTLFSSAMVFDGTQAQPYTENAPVNPLTLYGRSKAEGERRGIDTNPSALVVRTSTFFSPYDLDNIAMRIERTLRAGGRVRVAADHVTSPVFVPDLVRAALDLAVDGERGVWHLTHQDAISLANFAHRLAAALGLDHRAIDPVAGPPAEWQAVRPRQAALASVRGRLLPSLDNALARHCAIRNAHADPASEPLPAICFAT